MNKYGIEFYVGYNKSMVVLPVDIAGTLYAINPNVETTLWFNNETGEWKTSHMTKTFILKPNSHIKKVDESFDNGYISVKDALQDEKYSSKSIISTFPKWVRTVKPVDENNKTAYTLEEM